MQIKVLLSASKYNEVKYYLIKLQKKKYKYYQKYFIRQEIGWMLMLKHTQVSLDQGKGVLQFIIFYV